MFNKLNNKYFDTQKVDNSDSDTITLMLRDGYQDGDKLSLNLEGINYSWQPDSKSLIIDTDEATNISYIMNNISLEGQGVTERFIEAKYISKNGESFDLDEYHVQPASNSKVEPQNATIIPQNANTDNIDLDHLLDIIEENVGADFINATDESIPYRVKPIEDGNVYEILQDSFSNNESVEIFNYNIQADKIDINNFIKEFSNSFEYTVESNNNDVQINMHHAESDYSIVFKDIAQDLNDDIASILDTVIFKS